MTGQQRIIGEHVYTQWIREEDKAGIINATADWRADGAMNLDSFEGVFPRWLQQNEKIKDHIAKQTEQPGTDWWFEEPCWGVTYTQGIYLKSDDSFVGFERSTIGEKSSWTRVFVLVPEVREKGYFIDASSIGLKALFETYGCLHFTAENPTNISTDKLPYMGLTPTEVKTKLDRVIPVEYKKTIMTREGYAEWINKPENSAIKNNPYEYHWRYTG